jgi:hypothetical protein
MQWHVNCIHLFRNERMATRMNMMKLLQEVRGFAEFTNQHPAARQIGPLMLPLYWSKTRNPCAKRTLRIIVQDPPDIPNPVKITYISAHFRSTASAEA